MPEPLESNRSPGGSRAGIFRRVLVRAVAVVAALALLELGSWVALRVVAKRSLADLRGARADLVDGPAEGAAEAEAARIDRRTPRWVVRQQAAEMLHPFLGFVGHPERGLGVGVEGNDPEAAAFGFSRNRHPLLSPPAPGTAVVVVLGGSVAVQIAVDGGPRLERRLASLPRYAGREVRVLNLAQGGYKQPQQIMTLAWFSSLGLEPDLVLNLDGFNEVTLPLKENLPVGTHPFYPRSWRYRTAGLDPEELEVRGELTVARERRARWARRLSGAIPDRSPTANLVWLVGERRMAGRIGALERDLVELAKRRDAGPQASGPPFPAISRDETMDELVAVWSRGSRDLAALATAVGADYRHFLQPNQYLPGSKPLSDEERAKAFDPHSPFRELVVAGYPRLISAGARLRLEGIPFHDLSGLFSGVEETAYADDCCHFTTAGIARIVDAIVDGVEADG